MHIKKVIFAAFLFLAGTPAIAQDWSAVQSLKAGTRVYIATRARSEMKGKIVSVSDTTAALRAGGKNVSVRKDEIVTVHLARRGSFVKRALIGAAAGAGIGTAIGIGIVAATRSDGLAAAGGFLYGIPIGAAVGASTTGHKRGMLIYSSQ